MLYQVSRDGQMYGPYTLEDLTRYVASGNVLLTDLAKGEGMADWMSVSQVLGTATGAPPFVPGAPPMSYPGSGDAANTGMPYAGAYDPPPNLSWGLVLLFGLLTCTLFVHVWNLIVAAWANRIVPTSKVLLLYIAATVLLVLQGFSGAHSNMMYQHGPHHGPFAPHPGGLYGGLALICWVVRLVARFTMRSTLEEHYNTVEPMGLRLSAVMTFFFGGIYFQYHLNRINDIKRTLGYRAVGM